MKLAMLGGSGRTGRLIVQQALEAGHQVRVLVPYLRMLLVDGAAAAVLQNAPPREGWALEAQIFAEIYRPMAEP